MRSLAVLWAAILIALTAPQANAQVPVKLGIVGAKAGEARRFKALATYLERKGVPVTFVSFPNYGAAANTFASGSLNALICGSSVAGVLQLKDLAEPAVRPVSTSGSSTYHPVIVARKGSPPFRAEAAYFKNQRVAITSASSGEFFFLSLPHAAQAAAQVVRAETHREALEALSKGAVDLAVIKNHTWTKNASRYPELTVVGRDDEEEPDDTLMFAKWVDAKVVNKVVDALLALRNDESTEAKIARQVLDVREYIRTTRADFKHTFDNLRRAGVDASYKFK